MKLLWSCAVNCFEYVNIAHEIALPDFCDLFFSPCLLYFESGLLQFYTCPVLPLRFKDVNMKMQ